MAFRWINIALFFLYFAMINYVGLPSTDAAQNKKTPSRNLPESSFHGDYQTTVAYKIGDTAIEINIYQQNIPKFFYLNLHDNENTSVEATRIIIKQYRGRFVEIKAQGQRLISFSEKGQAYLFDPNRIFTEKGAQKTLTKNGKFSIDAHKVIRIFAKQILQYLGPFRLTPIVAVHNNIDGNYSINSYLKGAAKAGDAAAVFINPAKDPDDFFYVNYENFYHYFQSKGFNVVLQNNQTVTDDGSLSVYCGRINRPYINVEAQHGHMTEQIEMLKALQNLYRTVN